MTPAQNLKFPAPAEPAPRTSRRREAGTYTTTDSAVVDYQKRHGSADTRVLTALAERHNYTRKSPMTVAEIQVETDLGQRAVEKALKALEAAGFCHSEGRAWRYGKTPANAHANGGANGNANDRTSVKSGNAVQYSKFLSLKEVEGRRRKLKDNNIFIAGSLWPAQIPPAVVALETSLQKNELKTETPERLAPDGAASDEANSGDKPSPSQEKTVSGKGEIVNVTDSETVPPGPATYREAQETLTASGAWDIWSAWTRAHRLPKAAQDAQILQFAGWVMAGMHADLAQHSGEITAAGSYAHPWPALVARMAKVTAAKQAAQRTTRDVGRVFGEAKCRPGERRRDPQTGQVWTVEETAYGNVIFEEGSAPQDRPDAVVAGWEVLA
ncbi:hypothetical protein ACFP9V_19315 [Deinococcus radiopugnans]|uniref:DNA-binding transcriptional ArsR family regulator n=1 Tax=Deinococcus radiopugnans ATCC 19172 TaxID=585398 RepID=A0A5C4Y954_9DEIO|nr:hypothetical protein [Deinococcus radiopugnans]MBB6016777.1 DNA-binding transcriptional ArsR family regulator [Deinococcus radiopugnans ATCC 19172]TNM71931.1 hypothetical protein FHR04_06075 [Deinococcus radiopugnans ATCC 19172]